MEDISTFIWIGIAVLWLLSKLVGRGVKKATDARRKQPRDRGSRPTSVPTAIPQPRADGQVLPTGRGGTGPPPIVPR